MLFELLIRSCERHSHSETQNDGYEREGGVYDEMLGHFPGVFLGTKLSILSQNLVFSSP